MRNLKRLATSLVALVLVLAFSSCEKQVSSDAEQEVSFNINQLMDDAKKAVPVNNNSGFPDCSTEEASYVEVTIQGTMYTLDVLTGLNDGTETQVLKFPVGTYTLDLFNVFDADGIMIWSAPIAGSPYAKLWGLNGVGTHVDTGVDVTFTIEAFKKKKIDVDVLCWEEYYYDEFGFNWFDFQEVTIKTICFFGDVCTPNYMSWNQNQMDFVANIKVDIYDGTTLVGTGSSSYDDNGVMGPVCVEFPDFGDRTDDKYSLKLFVGNTLIKTLTLNANDGTLWDGSTEIRYIDTNSNVDTDGIVDFVYYEGDNCNYMNNAGVNFVQQFGGYPQS